MRTPAGMAAAQAKRNPRVYKLTKDADEAFTEAARRRLIKIRCPLRIDPKKLAADAVKRGTGD